MISTSSYNFEKKGNMTCIYGQWLICIMYNAFCQNFLFILVKRERISGAFFLVHWHFDNNESLIVYVNHELLCFYLYQSRIHQSCL